MISNKLDANKDAKGFIFDGFPRTVAQAEAWTNLLESKDSAISGMIALEVTDANWSSAYYFAVKALAGQMMPTRKLYASVLKNIMIKLHRLQGFIKIKTSLQA
jgi:hypothetical protein